MADFDIEQLKSLFDNLGDRLDKTKGDSTTTAELAKIRGVLSAMAKQIEDGNNSAKKNNTASPQPKEVVDEFFRRWKSEDPLKNLKTNNSDSGKTILSQLQNTNNNKDQAAASSALVQSSSRMSRSLNDTSSSMGSFAKALKDFNIVNILTSMFMGGAKILVDRAMDQADQYRTILASGQTSIQSINQMSDAAHKAGLTTLQLADAMSKGSEGTRKLGAVKWASLSKAFTDAQAAAGDFSLNVEQRNQYQDQYLDLISKQGKIQNATASQMANGIQSMVKSADTTAQILGQTRQEALDAKKRNADDDNLQVFLKQKGISSNSYDEASANYGAKYGEAGTTALKEVMLRGVPTSDAAKQLVATVPGLLSELTRTTNSLQSGSFNARGNATQLNNISDQYAKSGMGITGSQISGLSTIPGLNEALTASSHSQRSFLNTAPPKEDNKGTKGQVQMAGDQTKQNIAVTGEALTDGLIKTITSTYGPQLESLNKKFNEFLLKLQSFIDMINKSPFGNAVVATGLLGGFALAVAASIAGKLSGVVNFGKAALGRGGPNAGGALGGAGSSMSRLKLPIAANDIGRGAAAAEGAAGRTILSRLMTGGGGGRIAGLMRGGAAVASVAGGAGALSNVSKLAPLLKGIRGNAIIGSAFESLDYLTGQKQLNLKNLAKSGLRVGGSALGATLGAAGGSIVPVAGTAAGGIAGGVAGGWLGDKLGDAIFGADTPGPNAPKAPPVGNTPANRPAPANASVNKQSKTALTMDQMMNSVMESTHMTAEHMKTLTDLSRKSNDLLQQEINKIQQMSDRLGRDLSDINRNTRAFLDHAAR